MKHLKFILLLLLTVTVTQTISAYDFQSGNLYYEKNSDGTVTVTYKEAPSSDYPNYPNLSGNLNIPERAYYGGVSYLVSSINAYAFMGCTGLTSVTIPKSVTSIGGSAFYGCTGLTSIVVVSGNPKYDSRNNCNAIIETATNTLVYGCKNTTIPNSVTSIGNSAFNGCTGLTEVTIPNSVTTIGGNAFSGCTGLTEVTIPNSVTTIDKETFKGCTGLKEVTIPNSVTTIGYGAFSGCTGLTEVTIPNSVKTIGIDAFRGCTGLTEVTIPNSVTTIGNSAFSGCTGLTEVAIGNSVTTIGEYAFSMCWGLNSIVVNSGNTKYDSRNNCNAIIETATNTLISGCKTTIIPNSVTTIGNSAFSGCTGLTEVTIPNSVKTIGGNAFSSCTGLTEVTIPNSVTTIGYGAFSHCTGLTEVTIGNSVTSIGSYAFSDCTGLNLIISHPLVPPTINSDTFYNVSTNNVILIVYSSSYSTTNYWNNFANYTQGPGGFSGSGSGTANDPYLIFNPIQLYDVRNYTGYGDVVFKLMSDIDLTQFIADNNPTEGWEPIGSIESPFMGTFLGDGHTLSGFKINRNNDYNGFIAFADGARISNLNIEGSGVKGNDYNGGLCGRALFSKFNNINVNLPVEGANKTGGLCGESEYSEFLNCNVDGSVTCSGSYSGGLIGFSTCDTFTHASHSGNIAGAQYCGGIAGNATDGDFSYCSHDGEISGTNYCGGFAGEVIGTPVRNFSHTGNITGSNNTGGFAGYLKNSNINHAVTSGNVTGTGKVGGFIGESSTATLTGCNASGRVTGTLQNIGGMIGFSSVLSADSCYAIGDVESQSTHVGGFVGYHTGTLTIGNCGSVGDVKAQSLAGGFVGAIGSSSLEGTISNVFAVGDINVPGTKVGGLAGSISTGKNVNFNNSYYSGAIASQSTNIGGLVGYGVDVTLDKNYSNGSVFGNQYVGGIIGYAGGTSTITSNVAAQDVVNAVGGDVGRIYGTVSGSSITIGSSGTSQANRGMTTMKVISEGLQITATDGPQHGTNLGSSMLRYKSGYQGLGWNFSTDWTILETESYPFKPTQCAPPKFTNTLVSGGTTVKGKCATGAKVYVMTNGDIYQAVVNGTEWTATVDALQSGSTVKVWAETDDLVHSYFVTAVVGYAGSGTEDDPYLIYTAEDLASINSYSYYKIMNDIDLTQWIETNSPNEGWVPIGKTGGGTMKHLDGGNHTISGLWIESSLNNTALISSMENATVKNLRVNVASGKAVNGQSYTGIIVGKSIGSSLENIAVEGNLTGISNVGGIAGSSTDGTFSNISMKDVNLTASGAHTGGVAGYSTGNSFSNCSVKNSSLIGTGDYSGGIAAGSSANNNFVGCSVENSTIGGASFVGGITGQLSNAVTGLSVTGSTITATGNYVGGIVGKMTNSIDLSKANVTLTGVDYIGGIAGNSTGAITRSSASGSVITTDLTNCRAGGIVGYTTGNISNCYSSAYTKGGLYAGGIAGYSFGAINKCYSNGDLYATNFGGGIVGYLDGASASVNNCFAINNKIDVSDQNGTAMRVIGGFKNGASTPQANNYALKSMVVSVNDVTQTIYDDILEGIGVTDATLKQQATYTAQSWDFTETWGIEEGIGYPYLLALVEEPTQPFTPGDVNDDGTIDVADYVDVASYILEQDPQPFNFAAADLDEDNTIDVGDLVGVAYLALNYEGAPMLAAAVGVPEAASIAMDATVNNTASGQYEVAVNLNNNVSLTAMQMDINLPQGMTLVDASLTDRASASHQIEFCELGNGNYRLLAASSALKNFKNNDGAVLTLTLAGSPSGSGKLSNIILASPQAATFKIDDIALDFNPTGVIDVYTDVRIYQEGGNIVIVSPADGEAQLALPNGMYKTVRVDAGRNVYPAPAIGLIIVKMGNEVKKMRF